jgi:hypothetical protein
MENANTEPDKTVNTINMAIMEKASFLTPLAPFIIASIRILTPLLLP